MKEEIDVRSATTSPPFKGRGAKPPAAIPLKCASGRLSYPLRPAKSFHTPQATVSTTPAAVSEHITTPTVNDASASSANEDHLVVTPPSENRSTRPGLNGDQGYNGTMQSTVLTFSGSGDNDIRSEIGHSTCQWADEGLHQSSAALQVGVLSEQVAPERQEEGHLQRQSSTASTRTNQDTGLEEPSLSCNIAQASQTSLSLTSSLSSRVSKKSSRSSKSGRHRKGGKSPPSPKLERLAYSSRAVYKRPSKKDLSRLATPTPGRSQRSKTPSSRVPEPTRGSMDCSTPFEGVSQDNTNSASSNPRVVSRVSKQASSAGIKSLRPYRGDQRRFAIERRLKLVPEARSAYNPRAQRLSIAKENTEMLLNGSMNYAYNCLQPIEPNLPDITLDGLEAIVNDLVHTINHRDPSRGITIRGGRLKGQLIDRTLAETLKGYTMSCEQDAEFDPVVQLPVWHET